MQAVLKSGPTATGKRNNLVRLLWLIIPIAGVALGIGWFTLERPIPVQTQQAQIVELAGSFTAEAYVRGRDYELGPEVSGRIVDLPVREGRKVSKGEILFRLDSEDIRRGLDEAQAATKVAVMESARAGSALQAAREELLRKTEAARAALGQAEAELRRARKGPRQEEIDQAEHRSEKAQAIRAEARKQLDRTRTLVNEGAMPRVSLEAAEARYATASADEDEAKSYLAMLRAGPRPEDVAVAQRQVEAARANLAVVRSGAAQLEPLRLQVSVANAGVDRAQAAEARVRQTMTRSEVRAPVDGVVTKLRAELGAVAIPGVPIVTLSTREDLRIEAEIGSEDTGKIQPGMKVQVTSPAYPGRVFPARLAGMLPVGELKPDAAIRTRIVRARILLQEGWELFRPGMEVDVEGVSILRSALCVPSDAITVTDRGTGVFVIGNGRSHWIPVRTGYTSATQTEILQGLKTGQWVVVQGKDKLVDGTLVKVRP